jgi:DNA-binding winged helix-turn-helix (wHTH) protein
VASGFPYEFPKDGMRIRFDRFVLDTATRQLERDGRDVHVSPKAFDLLAILLAERPVVVTKEVLRDRLWSGTNVVDANLNNLVSEIRAALDDDPQQSRFVRTVHRVGYAFCGEAAGEDEAAAATVCWLAWGGRTIAVTVGEAIIGRDPVSGIWIDAPGVSRRHARMRVSASGDAVTATVEDLGSTNGTFVDNARVTGPVALDEGQLIRMGDAMLTFRTRSKANAPTKKIKRKN